MPGMAPAAACPPHAAVWSPSDRQAASAKGASAHASERAYQAVSPSARREAKTFTLQPHEQRADAVPRGAPRAVRELVGRARGQHFYQKLLTSEEAFKREVR